jgi:hypothetical protein
MKTIVEKYLRGLKRQTVQLSELEGLCSSEGCIYEKMAAIVLELEQSQTLIMIKAQGRNGKNPSLAFQYHVNKSILIIDSQQE